MEVPFFIYEFPLDYLLLIRQFDLLLTVCVSYVIYYYYTAKYSKVNNIIFPAPSRAWLLTLLHSSRVR